MRLRRPGGRREPPILRASLPRPDGARRAAEARMSSRGCSVSSSSRRRHGRPARPAGRRTALPPTQPWTWTSSCRPCPRRPTTRPSTPARPRPTPTGGSLRGAGPPRPGAAPTGRAGSPQSKRGSPLAAVQRVTGHWSRGRRRTFPPAPMGDPGVASPAVAATLCSHEMPLTQHVRYDYRWGVFIPDGAVESMDNVTIFPEGRN